MNLISLRKPDYAHVKNNILHAIPYHKHLEVRVGAYGSIDGKKWKNSDPICKVKIVLGVAVIAFIFPDAKSNIVLHLNYAQLRKWGPVSWLDSKQLMFMLLLIDSTGQKLIVCSKVIRISEQDTCKIKAACLKQAALAEIAVEKAVDFIYNYEISELWPED